MKHDVLSFQGKMILYYDATPCLGSVGISFVMKDDVHGVFECICF